jgi:glycyl-radical enzyme activating protein
LTTKPRETARIDSGLVFDIQRFSLFDGPGIRTTVFLKGCPLRCPWCHNPEGIASQPALRYDATRCVECRACVAVCPNGAHSVDSAGRHRLDRARCTVCGACAEVCPSKALEICGETLTLDDVMDVVLRDRGYYADSGGGITLSGGEPLLQPGFSRVLLAAAKAEGLHTAVETSGFGAWSALAALAPVTDLFLFDIKETEADRHLALTGVPLAPIHANLQRLAARGATIVLRLPMIPRINDRPDHIAAIAALAMNLPTLPQIDLLPYHRLGTGKRPLLGEPEREVAHPPAPAQVQAWQTQFAAAGLRVRLPEER